MDIKEAQKGDKKAKEQFILENQKLVMKIAAKYNREKNFDIEDLISEGNVGLMNAIKEYDASKDVQFSTYAVFWIKKMISAYVRCESKTVHITDQGYINLSKFYKSLKELTMKLNREPSLEEISAYAKISLEEIKKLIESKYKYPSFDAIYEANKNVVAKNIYDNENENPMDLYETKDIIIRLREVVLDNDELTEKQKAVLKLKYGLEDGKYRTDDDVGKILKITRQRVDQHEKAALEKIRKSEKIKKLEGYGKIRK